MWATFCVVCTVAKIILTLFAYIVALDFGKVVLESGFGGGSTEAPVDVDCLRGGPRNLCLLDYKAEEPSSWWAAFA